MRITAVLGSPREDSNSTILAQTILDTAKELGAETETFLLNDMAYSGCIACNGCKTKEERCVLEDDLTAVLESIADADAVILASPIYFGEVSGQFKCAFDRTFSFLNPDFSTRLKSGKQAVLILSQGQPDENLYTDVFPRYEYWLKAYGFVNIQALRATGVMEPAAVKQKPELLDQAGKIARSWIQGNS